MRPEQHIPRKIRNLLDELKAPWTAEPCKNTVMLRVAGRPCQTFPTKGGKLNGSSFERNALAAVRRAVRNMK